MVVVRIKHLAWCLTLCDLQVPRPMPPIAISAVLILVESRQWHLVCFHFKGLFAFSA